MFEKVAEKVARLSNEITQCLPPHLPELLPRFDIQCLSYTERFQDILFGKEEHLVKGKNCPILHRK